MFKTDTLTDVEKLPLPAIVPIPCLRKIVRPIVVPAKRNVVLGNGFLPDFFVDSRYLLGLKVHRYT